MTRYISLCNMKTTIHIKPPSLRTCLKKQKQVLRSQSTMFALAVFLLLLTETTAHIPPDTSGHGRGCIAREREALLSIKAGITVDDDSLSLFSSWHGQDCCRWMGVRCSNRTGHVIKLDLHEGFLIGEISSSLKDLEHLRHLDLGGNYLTGPRGRLPDFLGSLHDLRYLDLSGLDFSGPVPHQLGNLSRLLYLDLASGYDQLYSRDISWLRQLSSLKHLDMTSVNLSTVTGWVDTVNMLSFLEVLMLSGCWLPPNNSTAHSAPHTNLTRLKTLDLSSNSIETFHNVAFVWGATSLKHLSLEHNMINDVLPAELGNLSALEILQLSENMMLKGMLPDTLMNLCNLKIIELSMNQLEGDMTKFIKRLPKCSWSKLQVLLLDGNNITGSLPDLVSRMTSLINLNLASNRLTGTLPTGIGNLSNLTYLDLHNNQMSGLITEEHFSKLSHLQELHLSANSFTMEWNSDWLPPFSLQILGLKSCCVGPGFPQWLKWQENISELYMSNASIADTMPDWFWVVFSKATILDLSSNNISGSLPATLGQMEAYLLDLSSNQFTGSVQQIPPNITVLDLSRNSLSGPLPLDVGSPMLVKVLGLSDNYFTGMIPTSICQMKSLTVFDIGNNMITGQLPQCSEYMASGSKMVSPDTASPTTDSSSNTSMHMSIQTLRLSNNNLSGEFPLLLQNCLELNFIDLGQNKFFGSIPAWIGEKLARLAILRLRSNMFSGSIPSQLRELVHLQYLDLADNNFSGNIPKSLLNMDGVSDIAKISFIYFPFRSYGSSDELAGSLGPDPHISISAVTKGQRHEYTGHFIYMVNLDLSCNHLTGGIPKRIGPTTGLVNMNLSRNHLTGKIPENIGSMHSLESLDLSDNRISGEIPSSLSDLTSLSYLNLSYNNLSGRIPSGHQLDTLNPTNPASMYTGNIGLCGPPLQKNCSGNGIVQSHFSVNKEGSEIMTLYYGLSVGFVVGLWVVFCLLLFKKTWRTSYFLLFDEQRDALYVLVVVNWARMTTKATPTS